MSIVFLVLLFQCEPMMDDTLLWFITQWRSQLEMPRPRKHIPLSEKLAATLACLLTQEHRDSLRGKKASASEVLSLFHFDHIELHAFNGSDSWFNLDPKLVEVHRAKTKTDIGFIAKIKRQDKKWSAFMTAIASHSRPPKRQSKWPKRKFK